MQPSLEAAADLASHAPLAPQLRRARFDDYEGIARLWQAQSWPMQSPDDWRGFWLANPVWSKVSDGWPIGWVLETAGGELVGSIMNIPMRYKFQGADLICGAARGWLASERFRGYALWLMDEYLNQPEADLCISTSAGPMAVPIVEKIASRIPLGDWDSGSYWLLGYVGLVQRKLGRLKVPLGAALAYPAAAVLTLSDALTNKPLARLPRGFAVEFIDCFDSRFDAFWDDLARQNTEKLLSKRDARTLAWHYGIAMRSKRVWIFTASRNRRVCAYCVLVMRGKRELMQLVDFQTLEPEVDLLPGLLRAVLRRCVAEDVNRLDNLGRNVPKMRAFDECAPHRAKLPSWRCYYHASDQTLNTALRQSHVWDPSAFDGDTSLT